MRCQLGLCGFQSLAVEANRKTCKILNGNLCCFTDATGLKLLNIKLTPGFKDSKRSAGQLGANWSQNFRHIWCQAVVYTLAQCILNKISLAFSR